MGTATSFTVERSLEIENNSIVSGVVRNEYLYLIRKDDTEFNAGRVKGETGAAGAAFNVTSIPPGQDLNMMYVTGFFIQRFDENAVSGTNYPEDKAGLLQVMSYQEGIYLVQAYTVLGGSTYTRSYFNNTWSAWNRPAFMSDIPVIEPEPITPYFCAHRTASVILANSVETIVNFNGIDLQEGGMTYSAGSLTVPKKGKYTITSHLHLQSAATAGTIVLRIYKNGTIWRQLNLDPDGVNESRMITSTLHADAGDIFQIRVSQSTGADMTLYGVVPGIRYTSLDVVYAGL